MASINSLLEALSERRIAKEIGIPHDESRMRYPVRSNTVSDFDQFSCVISDYYAYHQSACVARGGVFSRADAYSEARNILAEAYRRRGGNIVACFNDAHEGTNGGVRRILDELCEALKEKSVKSYVQDVFDRHVAPSSFEKKVEIIRQFIVVCGPYLSSSIQRDYPERYASSYEELIQSYVNGLRRTSSIFRSL